MCKLNVYEGEKALALVDGVGIYSI